MSKSPALSSLNWDTRIKRIERELKDILVEMGEADEPTWPRRACVGIARLALGETLDEAYVREGLKVRVDGAGSSLGSLLLGEMRGAQSRRKGL